MKKDNANMGRKTNQPLKFRSAEVFLRTKVSRKLLIDKVGLKAQRLVMQKFPIIMQIFY